MGGKEKKVRQRRLKSMEDVRRFLADTINRLNRDELDTNKASKLGYLCQVLARVVEGSSLDRRVSEIEKIVKEKDYEKC